MTAVASISPISSSDQYARFLIHGQSGIGKTTLAAQSPKCLMLFNDVDQGRAAAAAGSKADQWVVQDYSDLRDAIGYLRHDNHDYEWVWLDNGTLFQDQGMQEIMADVVAAKPHRDILVPDKAEYMKSQQSFYYAMTELKSLPMNVGLICHSMDMDALDDEGEDYVKIMPMLQGGRGVFSEKICGMMSVVGYYRFVDVKDADGKKVAVRQLVTNVRGRIYAKDRYGVIGDMQNPTMDKIIAKIGTKAPAKRAPAKKAAATKKAAPARKAAVSKKAAPAKKAPAKKAAARPVR